MTNKTITLSRELAEQIHRELTSGAVSIGTGAKLRAALADPVSPAGGGPEVLPQQKPRLAGYWFDLDLNDKIDDTFAKGWNAAGDAWQPHVTRLQAEVGDIRAQLGRQIERSNDFASKWSGADAERLALQSELTKARELIDQKHDALRVAETYVQSAFSRAQLKDKQGRKLPPDHPISADLSQILAALSNQSAPTDKGQGEPVHMCQKCNGLGYMPTRNAGEGETEYRNRCKLYAEQPAPVAVVTPPEQCRQRIASEGKPYPRSSCAVCGQFSPKSRECDALIEAARLNPIQQ